MLSGAWDSFLSGIFSDDADMGVLGENLMRSVGAVIANIGPRIASAIQKVVLGLPGAFAMALRQLPSMLEPTITAVFGEELGGKIVDRKPHTDGKETR